MPKGPVTVRRLLIFLLFAGVAANVKVYAQGGSPDPAFASIPFAKWLTEGEQNNIRWSVRVPAVELSAHQRLVSRVEIEIDGNELLKRRAKSALVMLVQFSDAQGLVYQAHKALNLEQVEEGASKLNVVYTQYALVIPGDYRIALAILDTATGEHSVKQRTLHVNPLRNDPFPESGRDLPPVEILQTVDELDGLFLPYVKGQLYFSLETRRPVRVEVLVNASPTAVGERFRAGAVNNRSLNNLIPALKVISRVHVKSGTLHLTALDLTRRQVIFRQQMIFRPNDPRDLNWPQLRKGLEVADPNKIDVRALENREQNAQFFVSQLHDKLDADTPSGSGAGEALPVLIVLSGPMAFNSGEDLRPIEAAGSPDRKIFYIRYHAFVPRLPSPLDGRGRPFDPFGMGPIRTIQGEPLDALEPLLKPLQPRVFDVYTPQQFRGALSDLLREVSKM